MAKKKKVKRKAKVDQQVGFEQSLSLLETIVADLESGELDLETALEKYEQGIAHLRNCQAKLQQATRQIELLSGMDAAGNPITEPFDDQEDESLETKQSARSRRRGGVDDSGTLF